MGEPAMAQAPRVDGPSFWNEENIDEESTSQTAPSRELTDVSTSHETSDGLPYRLHSSAVDSPTAVIADFPVRFALPCVRGEWSASARPRWAAQVRGGRIPRGYTLYARYDGHTPRSLVTGRSAPIEVPLTALGNEWTEVEPGVHEVLLFLADGQGHVPRTSQGHFAVAGCRFRVSPQGYVEEVRLQERPAYSLILGATTLHGAKQTTAHLVTWWNDRHTGASVRSSSPEASATVRVGRPDGGYEAHEVMPGPFELAPLQPGDYTFTLHASEPKTAIVTEPATLGYVQRLIVNPE